MFSFFLNVYRFAKIIFKGIKEDSEFRFLFLFVIFLLIGSTLFYYQYENWLVIDALYFSVMTMSTVGYGDFVPNTVTSKIFTIIFTFLSIGAFVALTANMIQLSIDNSHKKVWKRNKSKKQ
ncbi:potassium channel family protein [Flavobacteriaceae bacterium GSB9]|nr:potassium channel family protein [Flavobacteriaceae bacterium GSB9]